MSEHSVTLQRSPGDSVIEPGDPRRHTYANSNESTTSIRSSIFDYEEENGRSYHAFRRGKYVMPNDEIELNRMDLHYHALRETFERMHWICPLRNPSSILDVGAGTGIWAMDVADDHPDARVIGIDLSPTQPSNVPPNLEFQIMDADEEWDFSTRFDFVHTRGMNGFGIQSWSHFYSQAFEHMQPGGWVENQEFDMQYLSNDDSVPENGALCRWAALWNQGIEQFGKSARCDPIRMMKQMQAAGFVNVSGKRYKQPITGWPRDPRLRDSGNYFSLGFLDGLQGMSLKVFTQGLGWEVEQMEVLLYEVRQEFRNMDMHGWIPIYVVWGQKPPVNGA